MMLTHCGNNVRNRYSGCVFSVKDIVPVPLKTSRNPFLNLKLLSTSMLRRFLSSQKTDFSQVFLAPFAPLCGKSVAFRIRSS